MLTNFSVAVVLSLLFFLCVWKKADDIEERNPGIADEYGVGLVWLLATMRVAILALFLAAVGYLVFYTIST